LFGWQNDDIENSSKEEVVFIFKMLYGKLFPSNEGHNPRSFLELLKRNTKGLRTLGVGTKCKTGTFQVEIRSAVA
jgi:hypothetical protein